ncbi:hypothetical protein SEA_JEMERALD_56 [Microbacterium phage Jemerald]|nr:hypothetical protein SEA_JUICER_56 [Microbacterium phage Juicer]WNO27295.1 hypothetical protein SEA_JEMERALD_56 [Microbacterium phage Jemerald]
MGIREVKIYTCDGCKATATLDRSTQARGWHTISLGGGPLDKRVLCTVCYGAVEWVAKFQGITRPPKVYQGPDNRFRLRKVSAAELPPLVPRPKPAFPEDDDWLEEDDEE